MTETKIKKIIAIGDTHGRDKWKRITLSNADRVIFLGDYFDSFSITFKDQLKNFKEILSYKKKNPKKVILLLGNHDYQYIYGVGERYSGYQPENAGEISEIITKLVESGTIKPCFCYGNFLFSHAGVTKTWYEKNCGDDVEVCKSINNRFENYPLSFGFTGTNPSGDNITQTPIWVRPSSLLLDKIDNLIQVVGHTHQEHIKINSEVIFIDSIEYSNEYLIINNGTPEVGRI